MKYLTKEVQDRLDKKLSSIMPMMLQSTTEKCYNGRIAAGCLQE